MQTYGGAYEQENIELLGRRRIYTDVAYIDETNVIEVLQDAVRIHEMNRAEIAYLLRYEKGIQPLKREKKIRSDIDIKVTDNLANQVVEFKLGYNWGNSMNIVRRDEREAKTDVDADGISILSQMNDQEKMFSKDQVLGRFVEICGIGFQMVDIKSDYEVSGSVFDVYSLNPLYTFIVYRNDVQETKLMSVTYRTTKDGDRYFTCYTDERRYEIKNLVSIVNSGDQKDVWEFDETPGRRNGAKNPLGKVPVVEFVRSPDRMGVFERQIPDMDALNIEVSDFANSVAQNTQEIWWMNDADFPKDPATGQAIKPVSGQWMRTVTAPNGNRPAIQALSSTFNYEGVQDNIVSKRNIILQKCYVPLQTDPGGGSTGTAMSMSAGWSAAEAVALKQENIIRGAKMELIELELLAAHRANVLPENHPLLLLKVSDISLKFPRNKTFDLGTKANTLATLINIGVSGAEAFPLVELFADSAQAWANSKEMVEKYQESRVTKPASSRRLMSDTTDQGVNSPLLDGMRVKADYSKGGEMNADL